MKSNDKRTASEMLRLLMAVDNAISCNVIRRPSNLVYDERGILCIVLVIRSHTVGKMMNMILNGGGKNTRLFIGSIDECYSTIASKIPDGTSDPKGVMRLDVGSDWSDVEAIKLIKNILRHGRAMLVYHGGRILVGPFVCYDLRLSYKLASSYRSHTDMS